MQIHNADASQVLFAFNRWEAMAAVDIGIDNAPQQRIGPLRTMGQSS